jgi:hypothetical protein
MYGSSKGLFTSISGFRVAKRWRSLLGLLARESRVCGFGRFAPQSNDTRLGRGSDGTQCGARVGVMQLTEARAFLTRAGRCFAPVRWNGDPRWRMALSEACYCRIGWSTFGEAGPTNATSMATSPGRRNPEPALAIPAVQWMVTCGPPPITLYARL